RHTPPVPSPPFLSTLPRPPRSTLFPYTTLFRSKWCTIFRTPDGLFEGKSPYRLHRDLHGLHYLAKLVERTRHALAACGDTAAFVVADVMDDKIAAEILEHPRSFNHVRTPQVVAHHADAVVASGLDYTLDRLLMSACHDDYMSGTCLCHHFGFEISAVHGLKVSND